MQQLWDLYPLVINWTEYPACGWCSCSFLPTSSMASPLVGVAIALMGLWGSNKREGESIEGFISSFWSNQQPFQVWWHQDVQDLTSCCLLSPGFWEKNDQRLPKIEFSTRQWDLSGAMCENFSRCLLSWLSQEDDRLIGRPIVSHNSVKSSLKYICLFLIWS